MSTTQPPPTSGRTKTAGSSTPNLRPVSDTEVRIEYHTIHAIAARIASPEAVRHSC